MADPTLYILDDNSSCRDSLCELGTSMGLRVCAYSSAARFLQELQLTGPGCAIMEYCLPDCDACDVQDELLQRGLSLPVIILTAHGDVPSVVASMKRGAVEYLEKPFPPSRLRAIIVRVIDAHLKQWELEQEQRRILALWDELSEEERAVAQHMALGQTNGQIAKSLEVSLRTVQFRRARLMAKMQVTHRADLVAAIFKAFQGKPRFHTSLDFKSGYHQDRLNDFLGIEFDGLRP